MANIRILNYYHNLTFGIEFSTNPLHPQHTGMLKPNQKICYLTKSATLCSENQTLALPYMKTVVYFTVNTLGSLKGREIATQNANAITSSAAVDKDQQAVQPIKDQFR